MPGKSNRNGLEIAIIGISGRFPGAGNLHEFWENLKNGVNSICFFKQEELLQNNNINPDEIKHPNYVKAKGIIDNIEYFDATFFGYSPREAGLLDPQVRIFYEICWEALEDAACDPSTYNGLIAVYAGGSSNLSWEVLSLISGKLDSLGQFSSGPLTDKDYLSTRISFKLDLKGPAISMNTACSTALVGLDLACRGLLTGQCDAALVGGVAVTTETARGGGYLYEEGFVHSPDAHVRTFDARAKGTIFSHGAGVVLLKRLDDATADGDNIYAVIKGFAVNNDGINKSSFVAPAVQGQTQCIRSALELSELDPETITYIEAHGTATELGDIIEIDALTTAFNSNKKQYCAIGSLKTNIGHLDSAAGIASLIKVALMIKHRQIPPSLNYELPNPNIDFENSPFFVNTRLQEWKSNGYPLRAGVSSFGVGGTNAHVILEEWSGDSEPEGKPSRPYQLLLFSARTANALEQMTVNLLQYLKTHPNVNLADVAYSLKPGRKTFEHRRMLVCSQVQDAIDILESSEIVNQEPLKEEVIAPFQTFYVKEQKQVVFMFPGQGSQYVNMTRGIYETEAIFRKEIDRCFEILKSLIGYDSKEILYPQHTSPFRHPSLEGNFKKQHTIGNLQLPASSYKINQTEIAQPVIFVIEYALAKLLMSWGIVPDAMVGHSIGEYVAACLSGVFSLEDALAVVVQRGKLMQQIPRGKMLSITLTEQELKPLLINNSELDLAAVNSSSHCVVSGPPDAIDAFTRQLKKNCCQFRILHTSHAFHSQMMDPILKPFAQEVAKIKRHVPRVPFISNVSGGWITYQEAADPGYWANHLRQTVRFAAGLSQLLKDKQTILIEVGPGHNLSTFVRQHPGKQLEQHEQMVVNLVPHPNEKAADDYYLLSKLGQVWLYGKEPDWQGFYPGEKRHKLRLPTYPFQRQYFWLEGNPAAMIKEGLKGRVATGKKPDIANWFYIPSWKCSILSPPEKKQEEKKIHSPWLVFTGDKPGEFVSQLLNRLASEQENHLVVVRPGERFTKIEDGPTPPYTSYTINPFREEDYAALINTLHDNDEIPVRIVHLLNLNVPGQDDDQWQLDSQGLEEALHSGFYSLLYLVNALDSLGIFKDNQEIHIMVITNGMHEVWGKKVTYPQKAVVQGPVMTIPLEYPGIKCCCIDIDTDIFCLAAGNDEHRKNKQQWLMDQLLKEFSTGVMGRDVMIAYREDYRLVRCFESAPLRGTGTAILRLKERGVYLINGGLGGIGLVIARHLAETLKPKLILTGRSPFPAKNQWEQWLDTHDSSDNTGRKIRKVKELEVLGAEVSIYSVDTADEEGMQKITLRIKEKYGTIHGVIHAAGVPGSGLSHLKPRELADKVLLPKVKGTIVLHRVLQREGIAPDFMVLCSSIGSVVPVAGLMNYFAANAFMDAFAFYSNRMNKQSTQGTFTISINWDTWQEVGMAVAALNQQLGISQVSHPLLEQYIVEKPGHEAYLTHLNFNQHWVLNEHMTVENIGLLPRTTYLEMVRAAFALKHNSEGVMEIRDVQFLAPLMAARDEEREVVVVFKKQEEGFEFSITSRAAGEKTSNTNLMSHARGTVLPTAAPKSRKHDIKIIQSECAVRHEKIVYNNGKVTGGRGIVVFGPRWKSLQQVYYGKTRALALIKLDEPYTDDLQFYKLHPALFDIASSFLYSHINNSSPYIPFSYKRLIIKKDLPAKLFSYSRWIEDSSGRRDLLKFNVTLMDENGEELVEMEEFTMLEVSEDMIGRIGQWQSALSSNGQPGSTPGEVETNQLEKNIYNTITQKADFLKNGILPGEGVEVFNRILNNKFPQVVVSTTDLEVRLEQIGISQGEGQDDAKERESPPDYARPELSTAYAAPSTDIEQLLADIWQQILGIRQVGIHDNFFELGGDSLKAITFTGRIQKETNTEITLAEFFKRPTIQGLAKYITDNAGEIQFDAIAPVEKKQYYQLSSAQKRFYFIQRIEPGMTAYNLTIIHTLEIQIDETKLEQAFQKLITRHEILRTSFELIKGEVVQRIHEEVDCSICYFESSESEFRAAVANFVKPFNLSQTPLFRLALVKMGEQQYILLLDIHHIITDGISMTTFTNELIEFYWGGEPSQQKLQYKDFCQWQNHMLASGKLKKQEEYWLKQFSGKLPVLNMPTDYPRPSTQSFAGDVITFYMGEELTRKLNGLMKETSTTLYMMILAIYNVLLKKYSGQCDIIIGSPIGGRINADLENMIGLLMETIAIRNFPGGNKTFEQFLEEVKENTLTAFENQAYPFRELLKQVYDEDDHSRNPLFDAMLILQNFITRQDESGTIELKDSPYEQGGREISIVDINLEAIERENDISFYLEYCTRLFKKESMEGFINSFREIAEAVVNNKKIKLDDIKISYNLTTAYSRVYEEVESEFEF
jgi:acyl transferase domain-containing protein/acyl carrier protein